MYCRNRKIHPPSALWAIFSLLSLVAIFPLEQVTPKNELAQSVMPRLQEVHAHQSLSATASQKLKNYHDYRRLDIRNSYTG